MTEPKIARCPICKQPTQHATRPFCSKRCRDVDLGRWFGGTYTIAGGNQDADEDGDDPGLRGPSTGKTQDQSDRD